MYQLLSQFNNTGVMRISVEHFKHGLKFINPKTGAAKFTRWSMFAEKVLELSTRESQAYTAIHFTHVAKETACKFTSLAFKIQHMLQ